MAMHATSIAEAECQLREALASAFPNADLTLGVPLTIRPQRRVFAGRMGATRCAIKHVLGPDAEHALITARAELDVLSAQPGPNQFAVNRCLAASAPHGLIVLDWAPGERLDHVITATQGATRAALLTETGRFLAWYTVSRAQSTSFAPKSWLEKMRALPTLTNPKDAALIARLQRRCQAHARACQGVPVRRAVCHGDFVGMNIHYDAGRFTAIDVQGQAVLSVARDVARFLVWQMMEDARADGDALHRPLNGMGLPAADCEAFLRSDVLPTLDQSHVLPFFAGEQLHTRFHETHDQPAVRSALRASITRYCDGTVPD